MRCVSYTRTTSCKNTKKIPSDIIQQQNEHIQNYIQSHGWKLVAKYSDRKKDENENTAFEEMTADGINRKFDMVVVDSVDRCGKYISCAEDVLVKTFFPAGLHFAIVQSDFCSIGKSREEIDEYFRKEKIAVQVKSMREYAIREQVEGYYTVHDEKYGYILSEDRKKLIVEEEAAKIVREIFQMTLAEISIKKIVAILNERGEESPMVHNARVGHKHWPHYENKWSEGALRRILECTAYDGYWQKTINGEVCTLSITPILDEGVFEQARRLIKSRTTTDNIIGGKPGPYVRKIYDEATGKPLYLRNFRSGDVAFVFNPQMSELPKKRKIYIEEAKVTEAVKNAISLEMDMAEKMKAYLQTEKMQQLLQKETQQYSEKAWMIFQEMEQVEKDRIPLYEKFRDYEIGQTEYQEKIIRKYGFHDWNSCLATVGHGGLKESQIVNRMYDEYRKDHPITLTDQEVLAAVGENKQEDMPKHSKSGIVVKGLYDVAVHFSKCCSPVPGDEIVGFVTRGRGVSIHRTDCVNILHLSDMERVRLIEAEWQEGADKEQFGEYHAEIKIFCHDRSGLLVDITKVFTEAEINISGIHSKTSKQGIATIDVAFQTKGKGQITKIVEKIRQIESVMDVERTTG